MAVPKLFTPETRVIQGVEYVTVPPPGASPLFGSTLFGLKGLEVDDGGWWKPFRHRKPKAGARVAAKICSTQKASAY